MTPSYKPKCPNYGCALEGTGFPLPKKGTGICPVSKCPFEFSAETDEATTAKDKAGNIIKAVGWKVSGNE